MELYASAAALKSSLSLTGDSFADDDIDRALRAASRAVEKACDRRFWLDDDATSVRYYTATAGDVVWIDDLVVLTSFATDTNLTRQFADAWTSNVDFILEPLNAAADGEPFTAVRVLPRTSLYLPLYHASVRVTGQFGWQSVPDGIEQATMMVASRLVKRQREAPFGVVGFGLDNAAVRIASSDPDVQGLLADFTRHRYGA